MDDRAVARWRMHVLRLTDHGFSSATSAVERLLAVQSENFSQAVWAVAARTPGLTQAQFGRLFDDGAILRTHVLRPTWHFVAREDIRWLVELTAPPIRRLLVQLQGQLGLDDAALACSAEVIAESLSGGVHLTREELRARLAEAGLRPEGQRLGVMLMNAEIDTLICSGALRDGKQTYALLAERAPNARRLDRAEALGQVALRYFTGHGPATERDLAYWATLTLTDVRAGLAAIGDQLQRLELDGRTYWFVEPSTGTPGEPRGHLLQMLDEYYRGYQDSRYVLDADGLVPRTRSATVGMTLVDGQMVGGMRRTLDENTATFEVSLYRDLAGDELAAVRDAAGRYGRFLGLEPRLTTTQAPE